MKSMLISVHGRSLLNCVWRCANGFLSAERPPIHIREGEKVCIQRTRPAHSGLRFASWQTDRIASEVVRTALNTRGTGICGAALSALAIVLELSATSLSG